MDTPEGLDSCREHLCRGGLCEVAMATGVLMQRLEFDAVDAEAHLLQLAEARDLTPHEMAVSLLYS